MRIEELYEGYQGQGMGLPAMFKADELKIDAIITDYLQGNIQSKEARKQLQAFGYDVYPNNISAWRGSTVKIISLRSEKIFDFRT